MTVYYISISDNINSRKNLEQLEKLYQPEYKYNRALGLTRPLNELKASVAFLDKQADEVKNNAPKLIRPGQ